MKLPSFCTAVILSTSLFTLPNVAIAKPSVDLATGSIQFKQPNPPSRGIPGGRGRGGAGRGGSCPTVDTPLTAVAPANAESSVGGVTLSDRPTIWVYVPYELTADRPAEFRLRNQQGTTIYQSLLTARTAPGIIGVRLPETAALKVGKTYEWTFLVLCNHKQPNNSSQNKFVQGWVERISPDAGLTNQLKTASPQQQAALYAESGIWYDAITTLAELRRSQPADAKLLADWTSLLKTAGLDEIPTKFVGQRPGLENLSDNRSKQETFAHQ